MGPPTYFLLILLLTMTSIVLSQSDTENAAESGTKASSHSDPFLFDPRSSNGTEKKCADGNLCSQPCEKPETPDKIKEKIKEAAERQKVSVSEFLEKHNMDMEKSLTNNKESYNSYCESECKICKIEGAKFLVCGCGSVKIEITGYLFALTVLVILLPNVFGFFGSYGLAMEKSCPKEKPLAQPKGSPPKPSDELATGSGTAPTAVTGF